MIRERSALMRQVQHLFHHPAMLGLFRMDDVAVAKPKEAFREPGRPREAGKFQDRIECSFGPFRLEVIGPFESDLHPMGQATISIGPGGRLRSGPLDATTWDAIAHFVKNNSNPEGNDHGRTSARGSDTGCGRGGVIPGWGS